MRGPGHLRNARRHVYARRDVAQRGVEAAARGTTWASPCIEVMPVAEFPGRFGWGYDGVFPFAPTRLYGTPDDFRAFVDAAHQLGLGVILDVVYNHLGPDGCVFASYAPDYFARHANEWGDGLNFDGPNAGPGAGVSSAATPPTGSTSSGSMACGSTPRRAIHDSSDEHVLALIGRRARAARRAGGSSSLRENEPQDVRMIRPLDAGRIRAGRVSGTTTFTTAPWSR